MKFKNYLYIVAIFVLEWFAIHAEGNFAGEGLGLVFDCSLASQISYFAILIIQLFFVSHTMDYYYNKDGIIYVIQSGSRQYWGRKNILSILQKTCFIKLAENIFYLFWCKIQHAEINLKSIGYGFIFSILTFTILVFWQAIMELKFHPEIAIFTIAAIYLVMTVIGNELHSSALRNPSVDFANGILFPNFLYYDRVIHNYVINELQILVTLVILNIISYILTLKVIKHHDMLCHD